MTSLLIIPQEMFFVVLTALFLAAVHPSLLPAFELRWKSLAGLSPDVPDYDSDELSDADELFIHHTDPRSPDTDGDGLSDAAEIANATDPLDPDENGDGIPDGTDLTGYSLSDTNCFYSTLEYSDALFSVTVSLAAPPSVPGTSSRRARLTRAGSSRSVTGQRRRPLESSAASEPSSRRASASSGSGSKRYSPPS